MLVTQKEEHGYTVYSFTANGTDYDVMTRDNEQFDVFSKRKSLSGGPQLNCYNSLEEMAQRSKALKNLATLIAA